VSAGLPYLEIVEDVADEGDVAHPLLQRVCPGLLAHLELLLEPRQQPPPEHAAVVLLGLRLDRQTDAQTDGQGVGGRSVKCCSGWEFSYSLSKK